jgi:hypothetical protein
MATGTCSTRRGKQIPLRPATQRERERERERNRKKRVKRERERERKIYLLS